MLPFDICWYGERVAPSSLSLKTRLVGRMVGGNVCDQTIVIKSWRQTANGRPTDREARARNTTHKSLDT